MIKIVLLMIVRNESAILERCLQSCSIADDRVIVDTGSTDDTCKIAELYEAELASIEWKNFGHCRSQSFDIAKKFVIGAGWKLEETYFLLMDADMVLHVDENFDKQSLTEHAYCIEQVNGNLRYSNIRLIRADLDWKCIGATHEYWSAEQEKGAPKTIQQLWIEDRNDGGSKSNKTQRDIDLLLSSLVDDRAKKLRDKSNRLIGFKTKGQANRLVRAIQHGTLSCLKDGTFVVAGPLEALTGHKDRWLYGAEGTEMLWSEAKERGLLK